MSNEITTTTNSDQLAVVMNDFFNIDFTAMNATIDKLANHQPGTLSKVEKKEANNIIDAWNENVVDKLRIEESRIKEFVKAVSGDTSSYGIPSLIANQLYIDELEQLIDYAGATDIYERLCDAINDEAVCKATRNNATSLDDDIDTTRGEYIKMVRDREYQMAILDANLRKAGNKVLRINLELVTALNSNTDVKKLLTALKKKASAMVKMKTQCCDMAQQAKINITIDDQNMRDTLRELIALTK